MTNVAFDRLVWIAPGYECGEGAQALHYYTVHRPDWVLMDIEMDEMDGIAATRQINAAFSDARIIIVTNYDDDDFRETARQVGACEYVLKENLLDVVRILCGGFAPEILKIMKGRNIYDTYESDEACGSLESPARNSDGLYYVTDFLYGLQSGAV